MEGTVTVKDLKLEHLGKFINLFRFGTKDLMIPYLFREGIKLSFIVVCNLFLYLNLISMNSFSQFYLDLEKDIK